MKQTILNFKVGDLVRAQVVEKHSDVELIVNFDGDLLRVVNDTGQYFHVGNIVSLQVKAIQPLSFAILAQDRNAGFNVIA